MNSKMEIIYRKVKQTDNFLLAKMIRTVFEEHNAPKEGTVYTDPTTDKLYNLFQTPNSVLWVAEIDNEPHGCCGIYPTPGLANDCAELVKFYLAKQARGKGIGRMLMQKSIDSATEMGFRKIYIESMPEFAQAVSIYEKYGFKRLVTPLGNSGHSGCNIWMLKNLEG